MNECFVTSHASGPCAVCRETADAPLHVVGERFYCPRHCPEHGEQEFKTWGRKPETLSGEQGGLF